MIVTHEAIPSDPYDVCLIGAGPAGITLALELESSGMKVCVLEAGGDGYDRDAQRLLEGTTDGDRYPPLRDTRMAALGGSSHVWAGWCRPLDPIDFEPRPGRDAPGWPFDATELEPHYRRAHDRCGLGAFDYESPDVRPGKDDLLAIPATDVAHAMFRVLPMRFGAEYRRRLETASNVHVVLRAPVTQLDLTASGECESASVVRPDGSTLVVRARRFVLAAGGIENARLLLLSADEPHATPGNASGLVGRYFTDHPFANIGTLHLSAPHALGGYFPHRPTRSTELRGAGSPASPEGDTAAGPAATRATLTLPRGVLERDGLLNAALFFHPRYEAHPVFAAPEVTAFLEVWNKLRGKAVPEGLPPYLRRAARAPHRIVVAGARKLVVGSGASRTWRCRAMFETESRAENRVTLGEERDALGRPLAHVDWRLSDRDLASMQGVMRHLDGALRSAGLGRIELACPDTPEGFRGLAEGGKHHMGTTRMHASAREGVVDPDGRVHGIPNLFVTGSSVFPSGGYANPTLTIVALAIRLADHLRT